MTLCLYHSLQRKAKCSCFMCRGEIKAWLSNIKEATFSFSGSQQARTEALEKEQHTHFPPYCHQHYYYYFSLSLAYTHTFTWSVDMPAFTNTDINRFHGGINTAQNLYFTVDTEISIIQSNWPDFFACESFFHMTCVKRMSTLNQDLLFAM